MMLIPVIIGVSIIVFFIVNMTPGDAASFILPEGTEEEYAVIRANLGIDRPLIVQYADYMWNLCHGDMGTSYYSSTGVFEAFMEKLPATLKLAGAALLVSCIIAIPFGIYSATHQYSPLDNIGAVISMVGVSVPMFWIGLLLIMLFTLKLHWLPSGGDDGLKAFIMPALTLGAHHAGIIYRMTRSSMLEVIRSDYIRTARAKGLSERIVIYRHGLGNALIPIVTTIGGQLATLVGGSVVIEKVFSWPGVGRLLIDSINKKDLPMIIGILILVTIMISILNLIVDIVYAFIDPRVKAEYKR